MLSFFSSFILYGKAVIPYNEDVSRPLQAGQAGRKWGTKMKGWIERGRLLFDHILGTKLGYRMLFFYIAGGVLPMILIGVYLISGRNQLLVDQVKSAESAELELLGRETGDLISAVNTESKAFYFDEALERIATYPYREYQELVDDYHNYRGFDNIDDYNRAVSWISVYMKNPAIVENAHFRIADEEEESLEWYQNVIRKGGGVAWQQLPLPLALHKENTLALTRLLRTRKGENVGVLVMYLRRERFQEQIGNRSSDTRIVLNGEDELFSNGGSAGFQELAGFLKNRKDNAVFQERIRAAGEEYILTGYQIALRESDDKLQIVSLKSYQEILQQANRQNRKSMIMFLVSVALSISMIMLFTWSFSRRVNRFRRQMQKAAAGNFDLEPSLGGHDEISELYDYLGTMIWDIQRLLSEIYRERIHAEQLKAQQKEAEFKVLASQINPHFLYNTLETIRMKARVNHQPEIEELVKMLAKLLRRNIRAGSQDVTIQEEIEMVEYYLKIQQYRFEERIQYQIQIADELKEYPILPLILQPIVENSIIHGLETKEGIGHILIQVKEEKNRILITVEDDGLGISPERLEQIKQELNRRNLNRTHIGVCNVHQRIRLKYGDDYGLSISSTEGKMTRVTVKIPAGSQEKKKGLDSYKTS